MISRRLPPVFPTALSHLSRFLTTPPRIDKAAFFSPSSYPFPSFADSPPWIHSSVPAATLVQFFRTRTPICASLRLLSVCYLFLAPFFPSLFCRVRFFTFHRGFQTPSPSQPPRRFVRAPNLGPPQGADPFFADYVLQLSRFFP